MPGVYSSQNPLYVGNSSTFYADINRIRNTGTVTWAVNFACSGLVDSHAERCHGVMRSCLFSILYTVECERYAIFPSFRKWEIPLKNLFGCFCLNQITSHSSPFLMAMGLNLLSRTGENDICE